MFDTIEDKISVSEEASHPLIVASINYDKVKVNQKINLMDERKFRKKYGWIKCKDKDDVDVMRKEVKKKLGLIIEREWRQLYRNEEKLPYYIVIDFEATCLPNNPSEYQHEIIEFPAVLVNSATLQVEDTFRMLCRPTVKPQLSDFCIELTGIQQSQIDEAPSFSDVLTEFHKWLNGHKLDKSNCAMVTDGPWDPCRFLYVQCLISQVRYPWWGERWLDLSRVFASFYKQKRLSLGAMLQFLGMGFEGRPHSGIDDASNIARILVTMICHGAPLLPNEMLSPKLLVEAASGRRSQPIDALQLTGSRCSIPGRQKMLSRREVKVLRSKRLSSLFKNLVNKKLSSEENEDGEKVLADDLSRVSLGDSQAGELLREEREEGRSEEGRVSEDDCNETENKSETVLRKGKKKTNRKSGKKHKKASRSRYT